MTDKNAQLLFKLGNISVTFSCTIFSSYQNLYPLHFFSLFYTKTMLWSSTPKKQSCYEIYLSADLNKILYYRPHILKSSLANYITATSVKLITMNLAFLSKEFLMCICRRTFSTKAIKWSNNVLQRQYG